MDPESDSLKNPKQNQVKKALIKLSKTQYRKEETGNQSQNQYEEQTISISASSPVWEGKGGYTPVTMRKDDQLSDQMNQINIKLQKAEGLGDFSH